MVKILFILLLALVMPLTVPAHAAARAADAVATCVFTVARVRGSINRDVYPYRGTLSVRGSFPLPGLLTLQAFTNTAQPSLLTLNNGKTLGSGAFVRSNRAGTLLLFRSRIKKEKWRLTTTLRLKRGIVHLLMTVCKEPHRDHGLGTANQDTDGWLPHTVAASVCLYGDDQPRIGVGTYALREKSQMDKKTIFK